MGKASRRKRERHAPPSVDRPRWEGADGFEFAWRLAERYVGLLAEFDSIDPRAKARAAGHAYEFARDRLDRQVATLESILTQRGEARPEKRPQTDMAPEVAFPGVWDEETAASADEARRYVVPAAELAGSMRDALTKATPILFDPLTMPEADGSALAGLRIPFPVVTCDFLNARGMSMPVKILRGTEWVGLVAATLVQHDDVLDVWPVVTTLSAASDDSVPTRPQALLYGRARFGAPLPEPPDGLTLSEVDGASVWHVPSNLKNDVLWPALWVTQPALAAVAALRLLDAVNVELAEASLPRAARRRAARESARIPLEVVIHTSRREATPVAPAHAVDWQHRWTVRGHWKHFHRGPIFNANPRKRVYDAHGEEVVKVWCPPFVKGPDDKPLVLKARRMADVPTPTRTESA